jgi:DNA-directed RNA polymerase specialized sigma24 family protein
MDCIAKANSGDSVDSKWDRLYQRHQLSLVRYACQRGCDEHEAWDVVQELFLRVHRRGMLVSLVAKTEEMQRAWLMRTLLWVIHNARRHKLAIRRSGGYVAESLDAMMESGQEVGCHSTPASEYDRAWAASVVERGLSRLRGLLASSAWKSIEPSLLGQSDKDFDKQPNPNLRVAVHRARIRLREFLAFEAGAGGNLCVGKSMLLQAAADHEYVC